jgi:hypothetical protein
MICGYARVSTDAQTLDAQIRCTLRDWGFRAPRLAALAAVENGTL